MWLWGVHALFHSKLLMHGTQPYYYYVAYQLIEYPRISQPILKLFG